MAAEDKKPAQSAAKPSSEGGAQGPKTGGSKPAGSKPGGATQGRSGQRGPNQPPQNQPPQGGSPVQGRHLWHGIAYIIVGLVALYLFQHFLLGPLAGPSTQLEYSEFKAKVESQEILTAVIGASRITGTMKSPDTKKPEPVDYSTLVPGSGRP